MHSLSDSGTPSPSRIEMLEKLFWAAAGMSPGDRDAFLSVECADDPDLRRELERMLAADEQAGAFLERPLPDVLAQDLPRASLARWTLLERVGEGGLGVVYRAERLEDGVRLEAAVKILRPGFDTGKFRQKFVQERQILAGLDHPGVVRLMDCGADPHGRSFLVMEFVRGEPLDAYLERTNPRPARASGAFRSRLRGRKLPAFAPRRARRYQAVECAGNRCRDVPSCWISEPRACLRAATARAVKSRG